MKDLYFPMYRLIMLKQICVPDLYRFYSVGGSLNISVNKTDRTSISISNVGTNYKITPAHLNTYDISAPLDTGLDNLISKSIKIDVICTFYNMFYSLKHMYSHFEKYDDMVFHVYNSTSSFLLFETAKDVEKWYDFVKNGDSQFIKISIDEFWFLSRKSSGLMDHIINNLLPRELENEFLAEILMGEEKYDNR